MGIWESFKVALGMLRLHKLRAFLTMLGVIIGVMSVTLIVMVSEGFKYFMTYQIQSVGADTITIMFDRFRGNRGESLGGLDGLKVSDVQLILDRVPDVEVASAMLQVPGQKILHQDRSLDNPRIFATDPLSADMNGVKMAEGRFLTQNDLDQRANICIIGEEVRDRLFPAGEPIGQLVTFEGITLEVVGIVERKDAFGETNAKDVYLPITTAQDKWIGGDSVTFISAKPKPGANGEETMNAIWKVLMEKSGNKPVFRVDSNESILQVFTTIFGVAGAVLAGIAALSLLVGGIGIMNIMLVSVTERTREIGLRKAVGARKGTVLTQFLVESALLSAVGGAIGMAIAWLLGQLITFGSAAANWPTKDGLPTVFPMTAALLSLAFSALIGVVFGLYPAARASSLSPIDALRTE